MAKVAIIGAGFAGHTAALVSAIASGASTRSRSSTRTRYFCYLPSLIWLGVGHMDPRT